MPFVLESSPPGIFKRGDKLVGDEMPGITARVDHQQ